MKRNKRHNLFYKYLLSYFFIFSIPVLILGFFMYYYTAVKIRGEIEQSNLTKLAQVNNLVELQMRGLEYTAAKISFDSRLIQFMMKHDDYYLKEAIGELARYKDNNPIVEEILLYFNQDEHIYSSKGMSSLQTLSNAEYVFQGMDGDSFKRELNQITESTIRAAKTTLVNGGESKRIMTYYVPVPVNGKYFTGVVVFMIDESHLTAMMNNMLGDWSGSVYLLDNNKEVLTSMNSGLLINESDLPMLYGLSDGISTLKMNNGTISVAKLHSDQLGWDYYTLLPTKQFLSRMFEVRLIVFYLLALLVSGGIVISIVLSLNNYRPVKRLEDSHTVLVERMGHMNPYVRDQVLIRLIKGDFKDESELAPIIPLEDIGMTGQYYYVMLVSVKGTYETREAAGQRKESLYQMLSELTFEGGTGYGVEMIEDNAIGVVVQVSDATFANREVQERLAAQIIQQLAEQDIIRPIIGVGTIYNDLFKLNRSFIEASAAVDYKLLAKEGKPIFFEDIHTLQDVSLWYPLEEQIRLTQSIKQGNKDVALETIRTILDIIGRKEQSFLFVKYMCFDVVNSMIKTINELGFNDRFSVQLKSILEFSMLYDLEEKLKRLIEELCQLIVENKEKQSSGMKDSIMLFIQEQYASPELSLELVSERFGLSVSYLSRLIKEQTGQTFTDCIGGLRMEQVKQELIGTDKPIKDIIVDSGYLDVPNFTRKFRQIEGVTPGQYRKMHT